MSIVNSNTTSNFTEIVSLCEKLSGEYGSNASKFAEGVSADAIITWEKSNGINIPESYKKWLTLSGSCQILFDVLNLFKLEDIIVNHKNFPDELVVVGSVFGFGDSLCFSKLTGEFVRYNAFDNVSEKKRFDDFDTFLETTIIKYLRKC